MIPLQSEGGGATSVGSRGELVYFLEYLLLKEGLPCPEVSNKSIPFLIRQ